MTPAPFCVEIGEDSLRRSRRGAITGSVFIRVGALCFPEEGWSDFAVVILGWWVEALRGLEPRHGAVVDLQFMDGPYWVRVAVVGPGVLRAECIENRRAEVVVHSDSVPANVLFDAVTDAAELLLGACDRRGWASRDVDTLRGGVRALRNRNSTRT